MEGDNRQRRERAKNARGEGDVASSQGVTTGASGQRRHLGSDADHEERIAGSGWGKQQPDRVAADPRPGSIDTRGGMATTPPPTSYRRGGTGGEPGDLDDDEERVFEAIVRLELQDGASPLGRIAKEVGMAQQEVGPVVRRLVNHHDVVQELPGDAASPDFGACYGTKARV